MGSNEDELLFDDEAADFLDTEDPEDAIRVRNFSRNCTLQQIQLLLTVFSLYSLHVRL